MGETGASNNDRILLVGTARSGTTWIGKVLGCADEATFLNEPDNVEAPPEGEFGRHGYGPYPVIVPGERSLRAQRYGTLWDLAFADMTPTSDRAISLARLLLRLPERVRDPLLAQGARVAVRAHPPRHRHVVAKTVFAHFCLDWLVTRYSPRVLLIQRHPLNVVHSWLELPEPLYDLPSNPEFLEHGIHGSRLPSLPRGASPLGRVAWCVGLLTAVLAGVSERHPEWPVVTHEDLCIESRDRFLRLYDLLGLTWSESTERFLKSSERPGSGLVTNRVASELPEKWRRHFNDAEVREILEMLSLFPGQGYVRQPDRGSLEATRVPTR